MMSAQPADIFLLLLGKPWQGNSCNLLLSEGTAQPFAGTVPTWMFKAGKPWAGHHSLLYFRALFCRSVEYQLNLCFKVRARLQR